VSPYEFAFFAVLVVALLALAGLVGAQQRKLLRRLREPGGVPAEDREHLHRQARRRLVSAVLMVVLAGFLIGHFFLHPTYKEVAERLEGRAQQADPDPVADEDKRFARLFAAYWAAAMFVLLGILFLAVIDFWATARHGLRSHRRLQADHRAQLQAEVERYRQRRANGEI
jgi:hypothetical protein